LEENMVEERYCVIDEAKIHYLEAGESSSQCILFLHGMKFSAQTWNELGTLNFFEAEGFHPVAVDFPGFGKSEALAMKKEAVLMAIINALGLVKPFIVAPSFSGGYSFPVVANDPSKLSGFVAIAPTDIPEFAEQLNGNILPALALWGSNDEIVPIENAHLLCRSMSNITKIVFKDAGHPCYMTETDAFHNHLLEFFRLVNRSS
jgi:pimeloyl-ACP methyl ester carboxylesterase